MQTNELFADEYPENPRQFVVLLPSEDAIIAEWYERHPEEKHNFQQKEKALPTHVSSAFVVFETTINQDWQAYHTSPRKEDILNTLHPRHQ